MRSGSQTPSQHLQRSCCWRSAGFGADARVSAIDTGFSTKVPFTIEAPPSDDLRGRCCFIECYCVQIVAAQISPRVSFRARLQLEDDFAAACA